MRPPVRLDVLPALALVVLLGAGPAPEAPVADAAMQGDLPRVLSLIKAGAEVNIPQGDGMTALHWAAANGSVEMAKLLIYAGANLEAVTRLGRYTPLLLASEGGNAVVPVLVEAGANVNATSSTGIAPLHFAALAGEAADVVALATKGADVNARELAWGQTPLMFAASKNRVEAIRALLDAGADISLMSKVMDLTRRSRRDDGAEKVRASVLAAFRARSTDPVNWRPNPAEVQAALRAAREHEGLEPVEAKDIVRIDWDSAQTAGRRPSATDLAGYQGGHTALLHAVREGHAESAIALLDGGADIDQVGGGHLNSPMLLAIINGHFDLGLELLRRGADLKLANYTGMTPLYAAIATQWQPKARYPQQQAYLQQRATHLDVMEALLEAGVDPNVRLSLHNWHMEYNFAQIDTDFWGATPFFRAAHALDVPAMRLLVKYGADPNIPTKAPPGDRKGDADIGPPGSLVVIPMPSGGGDWSGLPPVPDGGPGVYPIHLVSGFGGEGVGGAGNSQRHVRDGWMPALRYLVEELDADVTLRDYLGYGTIHAAAGRGMNDVIVYLLDKGADPLLVGRKGLTTVDLANGPVNGLSPYPATIQLLESMGAINHHYCVGVGTC